VREPGRLRDDRGSAVAEFALISVLLVFLLFAVLQVAAVFYVRSVAAAAASDGARYGAAAGVDPALGGQRASDLIARGLGGDLAGQLPCQGLQVTDPDSALDTSQVRCAGQIRSLLLPIGAFVDIRVSGRSLKEPP
jgi:Flp pilus assembly protein TadG